MVAGLARRGRGSAHSSVGRQFKFPGLAILSKMVSIALNTCAHSFGCVSRVRGASRRNPPCHASSEQRHG